MRLQKWISLSGYLSRRKAEEAILQGRVQVNGQVVTLLGTQIDPEKDEIQMDQQSLALPKEKILVRFYKPREVITSRADPQGRKTVMNFLPPALQTLRPIGRLDYLSEGLLLFSNDGDFANQMAHPRFQVQKKYHVWIARSLSPSDMKELKKGISLEDGPGKLDGIRELRPSLYEMTVSEGRNRFIRRMMEAIQTQVIRLKRIQIGSYSLGELRPGEYVMDSIRRL